jgi:hypothetical protein
MADTTPAENIFRVVDGKYVHNNEEISKAEFDKRKAETDDAIRTMRGTGKSNKPMTMEERKAKAFSDIDGMKKGGSVKSASARADGCAIRGKTRA